MLFAFFVGAGVGVVAGIVFGFIWGCGPAARIFLRKSQELDALIEELRKTIDHAVRAARRLDSRTDERLIGKLKSLNSGRPN